MMSESWKAIKGFEGKYEVSDSGKVRTLNYRGEGITKELKVGVNSITGYVRVALIKDDKTIQKLVHRLVAEAFIPNKDNLPCINHKDECKTNNHVYNLEWCTYKYNANYGTRNKRASEKKLKK